MPVINFESTCYLKFFQEELEIEMSDFPLPAAYRSAMIQLLGDEEGQAFLDSYQALRSYGLRMNTLKITPDTAATEQLEQLFQLRPVLWCKTGYYYEEQSRPGKHPCHAAGLYYIQEPSAMSAVELLDPLPGETVLDLAAAPGGKTTQIAAKMNGEGLLISNEIHPARAKILAENVERMGISNAVVTQASPQELSSRFPQTFDKIMLDAPCSGEGMFRKDPDAVAEWSPASVEMCAARQWDILHDAIAMLKPGGRLAYSTCTFNRNENEDTVARILQHYPFMKLITEKRIWPHLHEGEGHYVALLEYSAPHDQEIDIDRDIDSIPTRKKVRDRHIERLDRETAAAWDAFLSWSETELSLSLNRFSSGRPVRFGDALYLLPQSGMLSLSLHDLAGLKVPRAGLHLGEYRKGRFEPAHALAMALNPSDASRSYCLDEKSGQVDAYLRGEVLPVPLDFKGWYVVTLSCGNECYPLGWGKASNGQLKNHLPKGLRQH